MELPEIKCLHQIDEACETEKHYIEDKSILQAGDDPGEDKEVS